MPVILTKRFICAPRAANDAAVVTRGLVSIEWYLNGGGTEYAPETQRTMSIQTSQIGNTDI